MLIREKFVANKYTLSRIYDKLVSMRNLKSTIYLYQKAKRDFPFLTQSNKKLFRMLLKEFVNELYDFSLSLNVD